VGVSTHLNLATAVTVAMAAAAVGAASALLQMVNKEVLTAQAVLALMALLGRGLLAAAEALPQFCQEPAIQLSAIPS
jgi:hypothetical protein